VRELDTPVKIVKKKGDDQAAGASAS